MSVTDASEGSVVWHMEVSVQHSVIVKYRYFETTGGQTVSNAPFQRRGGVVNGSHVPRVASR